MAPVTQRTRPRGRASLAGAALWRLVALASVLALAELLPLLAPAQEPAYFDFVQLDRAQLLAYYRFEGDARDSAQRNGFGSQLAHHGIVKGAVTSTDGVDAGSLYFNGVSVVEVPLDINAAVHPQVTIGGWVKPLSSGRGGDKGYASMQFVIGNDDGTAQEARGVAIEGITPRWVAIRGPGMEPLRGPQVIEGEWTLVLASYDATSGTVRLSVNGAPVADSAWPRPGSSTLRIGAAPAEGSGLHGHVDSAFVYDAAFEAKWVEAFVHFFPPPLAPVPGTAGYAVACAARTRAFVEVEGSARWGATPAATLAMWVRIDAVPTPGNAMSLFSKVCSAARLLCAWDHGLSLTRR